MKIERHRLATLTWVIGVLLLVTGCVQDPFEGGVVDVGADAIDAYSNKDSHQFNKALDNLNTAARSFSSSSQDNFQTELTKLEAAVDDYSAAVQNTQFPVKADGGLPSESQAYALATTAKSFVAATQRFADVINECGSDNTYWDATCVQAGQNSASELATVEPAFRDAFNDVVAAR